MPARGAHVNRITLPYVEEIDAQIPILVLEPCDIGEAGEAEREDEEEIAMETSYMHRFQVKTLLF
jgi:hypothetical protein